MNESVHEHESDSMRGADDLSVLKTVRIDGLSRPVPRIFFGTAGDQFQEGKDCSALLDDMVSLGAYAIDTARVYGRSEEAIGRWIAARGNRDKLILLSKCGHHDVFGRKRVTPKEMKKDLETSLALLHTDYLDIWLLHRDDPEIPVAVIIETFNEIADQGKIRLFGGSNWTASRIEEANEYAYAHGLQPMRISSPHFGLAEQKGDPWGGGATTITGAGREQDRRWYEDNQMPVIAYSSLGRGLFSGRFSSQEPQLASRYMDKYAMKGFFCEENLERLHRCEILAAKKQVTPAQIAMAWMFSRKINTFAVVSTTSRQRMQENIAALHIQLTPEEQSWLNLEEA